MRTYHVYTTIRLRVTGTDREDAEKLALLEITKALPDVVIEPVVPFTAPNPQSMEVVSND